MSSAKFLRTVLLKHIVDYINDIIIFRKRLEILNSAKVKIDLSRDIYDYEVVDIIRNVIFRCSEISHLKEYKELKKIVSDWVKRDSWENEYMDGPYARHRENNYVKLRIFSC